MICWQCFLRWNFLKTSAQVVFPAIVMKPVCLATTQQSTFLSPQQLISRINCASQHFQSIGFVLALKRFRTMTGWCNNLREPSFGKSLRPFGRLAPARYADGVSEMMLLGKTGQPLPNPRTVSTSMHYDVADAHRRYTLMVMQWGQFLDHDVTLTPMVEYPDKSNISKFSPLAVFRKQSLSIGE